VAARTPSRRRFLGHALAAVAPATARSRVVSPSRAPKAYDVVVIGGGAIGATAAYLLRRQKLAVALVDKGAAGQEASWASAGMLQPSGARDDGSWLGWSTRRSRELYDELDRRLLEETGRRVGLGGEGGLVLAMDDDEAEPLRQVARRHAGDATPPRLLTGAEAREREPSLPPGVAAALLRSDHRYLDARTYTAVVVQASRRSGVVVREGQPVTGLLWTGRKVTGVSCGGDRLHAGWVINAAGAWAGRIDARVALPITPDHGQILALEGRPGELRHNLQRPGAGGYITARADGRVLVGATSEDFGYDKKVTPEGLRALKAVLNDILPHFAPRRVAATWSGLRPATPDGLPAVGPDPRTSGGYLWGAGHGGYGIMSAPATAEALVDLVLGRKPRGPLGAVTPGRFVR
jgi:glycine oxidase